MGNHFLGVVGETDPFDHDRAAEVIREYMRITTYEHRFFISPGDQNRIMAGLEDALREAGLVAPDPEPEAIEAPASIPLWARRLIDRLDALEVRVFGKD